MTFGKMEQYLIVSPKIIQLFTKQLTMQKRTMKFLIQEISLRKYFLTLFASFISSLLFSMIIVLVILKLDIISDGDYSFSN
jgi:hypothetical protein